MVTNQLWVSQATSLLLCPFREKLPIEDRSSHSSTKAETTLVPFKRPASFHKSLTTQVLKQCLLVWNQLTYHKSQMEDSMTLTVGEVMIYSHLPFRRHKLWWWCLVIMKIKRLRWCVCFSKRLSVRLNHHNETTFKCSRSKYRQRLATLKSNLATTQEITTNSKIVLTR